jgi:hypothetical protein
MKEDKNSSMEARMKELATIRDILMGPEMQEYAERFDSIDEHFSRNETETMNRFHALEQHVNERFQSLEQMMNDRFSRLEQLLAQTTDMFHQKIANKSTSDKADLGKMLAQIAEKLVNKD